MRLAQQIVDICQYGTTRKSLGNSNRTVRLVAPTGSNPIESESLRDFPESGAEPGPQVFHFLKTTTPPPICTRPPTISSLFVRVREGRVGCCTEGGILAMASILHSGVSRGPVLGSRAARRALRSLPRATRRGSFKGPVAEQKTPQEIGEQFVQTVRTECTNFFQVRGV